MQTLNKLVNLIVFIWYPLLCIEIIFLSALQPFSLKASIHVKLVALIHKTTAYRKFSVSFLQKATNKKQGALLRQSLHKYPLKDSQLKNENQVKVYWFSK